MIKASMDVGGLRKEIAAINSEVDSKIRGRLDEVGNRAVEIAKETGTYHDVTGRLRSSNKFRVVNGRDLVLCNDAPYAEDVEARGEVVLTTAALEAERMLDEDDDE